MSREPSQTPSMEDALRASGDLIYDWDMVTDQVRWLGPVAEAFRLAAIDGVATGDMFHARINSEDLQTRLKILSRHLASGERFDCEYRVRRGDGQFSWVHERGLAQFDDGGRPVRMLGTLRIVTQRKQTEERLEYLANFDELTGHFNRSRLRAAIDHALSHSERFGRAGAYLVIDIDNMAMINDAFGFQTGDAVIVALGERLDRLVGASDVIGRVEGDEFGILLDSCDETFVHATAERILRAVREMPMATSSGAVAITVSIGGLVFPAAAQTAHDVMARAERALHEAKRNGRNHFALYRLTEGERDELRADMGIAKQVQRALADDRLVFAYQPVVDGRTGKPAFYECLLRMRHPNGDIIPAGKFVTVVERLGLMRQIDRRALEMAVQELFADPEVTLSLNISGLTATDRSWLRGLVAMLKGKPEIATRLIVEITETAAMQDVEESARFVSAVRDLGCRVALDDFGAGYTSFRHLKALTVDLVKIDGSFVSNIMQRSDNQLFIRTLIGLASGFGLASVAECVETADEARHLLNEGVTYLQGWYCGKPQLVRPEPPELVLPPTLVAPFPQRVSARAC